jgi:hypothetical protein
MGGLPATAALAVFDRLMEKVPTSLVHQPAKAQRVESDPVNVVADWIGLEKPRPLPMLGVRRHARQRLRHERNPLVTRARSNENCQPENAKTQDYVHSASNATGSSVSDPSQVSTSDEEGTDQHQQPQSRQADYAVGDVAEDGSLGVVSDVGGLVPLSQAIFDLHGFVQGDNLG